MIYVDKNGIPFVVRRFSWDDYTSLVSMYDSFSPKAKFQGMPPLEKETSRQWIKGLLEKGENFLAWREGKVIGHVVVIPDRNIKDGEYLIFVSQGQRNRGVGSRLTKMAVENSKALGLEKIWLVVGAYNFMAINLYKKFGFDFCEKTCESEKEMILWL
jgi:ribosomal protein S18 acetylase RimI-like enzyme